MAVRMAPGRRPVRRRMALQLHAEPRDVDAVAHRVTLVGHVRLLQKVGDVAAGSARRRRAGSRAGSVLLLALREIDQNLRLQARVNVFGQLEGRSVVVHRGHQAEQRMRLDLDAGDDRLDIAPGVEQRRQRRPALLAHPVAFIQDRDAAAQHGRHQRARPRSAAGPRLRSPA